ncbi:MAG: ECF transporter S component [Clostridia bacterium]|nr:ECF transporter S component [Clostridia bacterium]
MYQPKQNILRLVQLGLLSGLILLLQTVFVIPLPGSLTLSLVLVPIVVGAILYGPAAGALLGGVFGVLVSVMAIQGQLGLLTNMMVAYNPVLTVAVCMLKGIACGWVAGLLYAALKPHPVVAVFVAAAAAPIVNTGIFLVGMLTVFRGVMLEFADGIGMGGVGAVYFAIVVLVGVNFLVEFGANLILSPAIASIVKAVKKIGK